MAVEVKRKEGETASSMIFRFTKRVQQSGVLREAKKRRFRGRVPNDTKRKMSAMHRLKKKAEFEKAKKQGLL